MAALPQKTGPGVGGFLRDIVELAGGIWVQGETVRAEATVAANRAEDFQRVTNGVNSDGSTLWLGQPLIPGVSNVSLLAATLALVVVGGGVYLLTND